MTKLARGCEDLTRRLGPYEGSRVIVVGGEALMDGPLELASATMRAAPQLLFSQRGKPPFDQVEPGGACRREVHMVAWPLRQPLANARGGGPSLAHGPEGKVWYQRHRRAEGELPRDTDALGPVAPRAVGSTFPAPTGSPSSTAPLWLAGTHQATEGCDFGLPGKP